MAIPSALKVSVEAQFQTHVTDCAASQEASLAASGVYVQTFKNSSEANVDSIPVFGCHIYDSPEGIGYRPFGIVLRAGKKYIRVYNVGPEKGNEVDWEEILPLDL